MIQTAGHQGLSGSEDGAAADHADGSISRILVVDDDPDVVSLIKEYLETQPGAELRYVVETAANGLEALAVVNSERPPDLIITDVMMPRMSGIELLRAMDKLCLRVPVIALTGHMDVAVIAGTLMAGATAYLPKPISFAYLDHLVSALLKIQGDA